MRRMYTLASAVVLATLSGCPEHRPPHAGAGSPRPSNAQRQADYDKQLAHMTAQQARFDEQAAVAEAQQKRMDALLTRWERQADRRDALLDLEERGKR